MSQVAAVPPPAQSPHVPPQNLEAEESVLGAMLLSPGAIGAVTEILSATDFYRESHGVVFRACLALYQQGEPVDAITLVDSLEERGELEQVGGRARIHELAALVPATANAAHYARIVREMATLRGSSVRAPRSHGSDRTGPARRRTSSTGRSRSSSTSPSSGSRATSATSKGS